MRPKGPTPAYIDDKERVRRLLALPGVRPAATERIGAARVALVGMGGLGNAAGLYLAAQGVGHLTLIDPDTVEAHNLGRQVLYTPDTVGMAKVEAAGAALRRLSPGISLTIAQEALDDANASRLLDGHDLILDGLDAGAPREVLNRFSVGTRVPTLFAGAIGYEAQVFGVQGGTPCLYCLWGDIAEAAEDCAATGVLGPVVGMAGTVQAQEAIKILMGQGQTLIGRLWWYDGYAVHTRVISVPPRPDCPVCSQSGGKED